MKQSNIQYSLKDKVAVITGATKGIGKAVVEEYLNHGVKCVLVARKINSEQLNVYSNKYSDDNYIFVKADVSKMSCIKEIVDKTNCPVSEASTAIEAVSPSLVSPTIITSGS